MIGVAFAVLLAATPLPQIHVAVGETVSVSAGVGTYYSESPDIAIVFGSMNVRGVRVGTTRAIVGFASGFTYHRLPIAEVIVGPCIAPTLTLDAQDVWIAEGESATLTAMTTGTGLGAIEWYEGTQFRGLGSPITYTALPVGTHVRTARVSNACGAASAEAVIHVVVPRRRTVRK